MTSSTDYLNLIASLIGVTALAFLAKGNVVGQFLTVIFSTIYAYISYNCAYYGELITYLFMTAPIAVISIISWLKHPFEGNKSDVEINEIKNKEYILLGGLSLVVTVVFYFILDALGTDNIYVSTLSVFTSFTASYLMFRRSRFYAIAYALNDVVLITLWVVKTVQNINYITVVICFIMFFVYDMLGFINWTKRMIAQRKIKSTSDD